MKIAFIATYPPQECGIATFTENLLKSVSFHIPDKKSISVIAVQNENEIVDYPEEVKFVIRKEFLDDYTKAARYINTEGFDICIIQHEYGIFGGESGIYILTLSNQLAVPFITTAHTILKTPSVQQRFIMKSLATAGEQVVVMTNKARQFLRDIYEIPSEKISIIEHGVPERIPVNKEEVLRDLRLEGRSLLMTFGLIGRNKGIETVIRALPEVIKKHPEVIYLVQGNTHPNVVRHEGEQYRESLIQLADELGVADHVMFRKGFMSEDKLFELLHSVDIYITPYLREEQITSGSLSYALGAGAPIVSTPYWHAQELLSNDRGCLFNFSDHAQLADILNSLLENRNLRDTLRSNALGYAHHLRWKNTGKRYKHLMEESIKKVHASSVTKIPAAFSEPGIKHILKLTDGIGIYQHAVFGLPNYHEGYCLDDNARALTAMTLAAQCGYEEKVAAPAEIYLSFIHFMQQPDGWFHNFLSFDRRITDERCSEDAYGRTMWALGLLLSSGAFPALQQPAEEIFIRGLHHANHLEHIRGMANTMIGLRFFLDKNPFHHEAHLLLQSLSEKMIAQYKSSCNGDWKWFSETLTYDNGILPLALFHACEITGDEESKRVAEESTRFLEEVTMNKGYLSLIGSSGWYSRGKAKAAYPQQAIDAMAMVLLFRQAWNNTGDKQYHDSMMKCYRWFFFENDLSVSLYDSATQGCYDGLEDYGLNKNQGAESTLALFISHYTAVQSVHGKGEDGVSLESLPGFAEDDFFAFRELKK